jgi:hypothetical protein
MVGRNEEVRDFARGVDERVDVFGVILGRMTHTGGKGWCPDPVHHKYIARKWTKDLANTHPEYSKDIQNFPS